MVAEIIDTVIAMAPCIAGWLVMLPMFLDIEVLFSEIGTLRFFVGIGLVFIGGIWAFACLFIFSWMEGKHGQTPGKRVLGVRVLGTELAPCGFGRALVRNLLMIVDGLFNGMVGAMIIAMTKNQQRLGDIAAKTIVIDTRKEKTNE